MYGAEAQHHRGNYDRNRPYDHLADVLPASAFQFAKEDASPEEKTGMRAAIVDDAFRSPFAGTCTKRPVGREIVRGSTVFSIRVASMVAPQRGFSRSTVSERAGKV